MRKALLIALTLLLMPLDAHASDCRVHTGTLVALYGTIDDPDVLVWDSRLRLHAYGIATFDESQALLGHALVAHPGTRARIMACVAHDVSQKFSNATEDAMFVSIVSGPLRGHSGWVMESAIRRITYH